jgi:hypothetical protein
MQKLEDHKFYLAKRTPSFLYISGVTNTKHLLIEIKAAAGNKAIHGTKINL